MLRIDNAKTECRETKEQGGVPPIKKRNETNGLVQKTSCPAVQTRRRGGEGMGIGGKKKEY